MQKRDTARVLVAMAALAGLAWPSAQAFAQVSAYTSSPVNLYAGPSGDYPVVSGIGAGVPVTVMGCVSDYSWCDVALPDLRGWVYAAYLSYPYQGEYVPLEGYGSVIGLPIIGFSLGTYWGSFYRDRPWYGERDRWAHVPSPGYGGRPSGSPPRMRPPEGGYAPGSYGRPPEGGRPPAPPQGGMRPPEPERPGQPPAGGHQWGQPPGFAGNTRGDGGAPRPAPGGNYGQPHPMSPEGGGRPPAPQPDRGFHPGGPGGGFEHGGAPAMRAPAPMPAPGRPAGPPPQGGGHPSGEGGGNRGEGRQPG
ncbi:SH3 domain-containing protein [Paraburkholderia caballeronis]|uniref:Uncharacterized conserved protein YraI n=1 Tax=Paraburkholderia caballeronis TaxID=416943 RepID=A0A1H7VXK1_9BURK|nr:SH3 domain-containing protein [Paraburkholderia caballeronis]PXW14615.1 uncharacterized protein YraI [Paraburkholderia caballeronis]PXW93443.1 uncharacterized protein YraI [Paraburkholderia caballeronis]RAJ88302.1 uncharacterized protein YraI [Paraburkholderia caballeronis]TDV33763.1 uncharacterized protein YraI [Paraburkholderia caballeronis]SEE21191.1 Uncharacterized conserved protein YraI [Paraburkholderia caballeronis]